MGSGRAHMHLAAKVPQVGRRMLIVQYLEKMRSDQDVMEERLPLTAPLSGALASGSGGPSEKVDSKYGTLLNETTFQPASRRRSASGRKYEKLQRRKIGLFSYTTPLDHLLIAVGTLASVVHGAGFPLLSIVLGGMTTVFLRAQNSEFVNVELQRMGNSSRVDGVVEPISRTEFVQEVKLYSLYYVALGIAMFVTSYLQIACWEAIAERIVHSMRRNYLLAMLRQEVAWFDRMQVGNLTSRLADDLERVREGIGDKASLLVQLMAAFISGFVVGFIYNWQMTLVMVCFTPALAFTSSWVGRMAANRTQVEQEKYAVAGAIAEETFSSIRTVLSLNGQRQEVARYEKALEDARKTGLVKYMHMAIGLGSSYIITHASYAVAFWFASRLVIWDVGFDRGSIFTVFFAVMSGSQALGGALPHLATVSSARGASRHVLQVINNRPKIDPYSSDGLILSHMRGEIQFHGIQFSYPLRRDLKILNGVSFSVEAGRKLALVGASGCGKSTIVNLLLRFYDPDQGQITLDGYDLRQFNVKALRDVIGVVSQEPILFEGTIEENIMLGNEFATREDVTRCCKMANAYEFIQRLPNGLYTRVGERGVQLSGGQKQRIAIARALIRNPKILLLDEATSALDTESELLVQKALDKAQEGRTTIIVAHRLSTIKDADQILVFKEGRIVESGTHEELYNAKGLFHEMVTAQQILQMREQEKRSAVEDTDEDDLSEEAMGITRPTSATGSLPKLARKSTESVFSNSPAGLRLRRKTTSFSSRSDLVRLYELQQDMDESKVKPTPISRIFLMNKGTWHFLLIGTIGCVISGLIIPFFSLIYAQIFEVFSEPADQMATDVIFWSAMFLLVGFFHALGFFISANALGRCGEALTKKLRLEAFTNIVRQGNLRFFDDERHNTGKLCARFATDAPNVRYVFTRLPVVISSVVTLLGAVAIGFWFGWKLALILLAIIPLIIGSGYFEMQQQFGKQMRNTELLEAASHVASEAIENIRTVHGLNKQLIFYQRYCAHLEEPHQVNMHQAHIYGAVFAFSQSLLFFMYALAFWVGSTFVLDRSMSPVDVFRVFFAVAFCGQSVGQISSFIPDVVKARLAGSLLFHLIEYPTLIDSLSDLGIRMEVKGDVKLQGVKFSYPTRSTTPVLRGLDLHVKVGETLALVGRSGCGKSTVISLLERFYNPDNGHILIDGVDIQDFNIALLRKQISLVSQEPILFDTTIAENITYGLEDAKPSHEEVVTAAMQANIHQFILGLPDGYQTQVGEKGAQLSGGQKQRIAIARALIRNPSVLLLDEATSALDSESEKGVQQALENARRGRTCIVIAHRLSTIQNASQIVVLTDGRVTEKGTHAELLAADGVYKALCQNQTL